MNAASQAMGPAADKLKQQQWHDAIQPEQKALQYLLRAEATFRQIQVAFGSTGGGGGGGGSAGRDLASLFDLELDTEKNQYETDRPRLPPTSAPRTSATRCRSSTNSPAASRNSRSSATTARRVCRSAGSRKCCAAKPKSCRSRWSSWRSKTIKADSKVRAANQDNPANRGSQANPVNRASPGRAGNPDKVVNPGNRVPAIRASSRPLSA